MNPIEIIDEYYSPSSDLHSILVTHSKLVADKALEIAKNASHFEPDLQFIEEAAMLHDIGIFLTNAPQIGCHGDVPYIYHGYLGGKILKSKGLERHARVCECHPGTGISIDAIKKHHLDLPERDMLPVTIEEKIICFADKFYSKKPNSLSKEISIEKIIHTLNSYGKEQAPTFESWIELFRYIPN